MRSADPRCQRQPSRQRRPGYYVSKLRHSEFGALASVLALRPSLALTASQTEPLASFQKEAEAHCTNDLVVWLDLPSKVYYFRAQPRYGSTPNGAYVCREQAERAGMKAIRSSQ
jgi:hypothetical protein